ncbi:hypothetical protein Hanom_Chr01g00081951 [Helianthus anomalus]
MLFLRLGIDKNIVDENDHETVQVRLAHAVHQIHENNRCVGQTKGHDHELVMTITCTKGGFRYIFFEDSKLMVPRTKIDL